MANVHENNVMAVDNDELTAFVTSTLRAIAAGIAEASTASLQREQRGHSSYEMPSKIAFDIAVTAKRSSESGKGLKVEVFSIGGDLSGKNVNHSETVSRITFEVPWSYKNTAPINIPSMARV
jgi:hypothetical protein